MQYVPRQILAHAVCCELGKTAVVERDKALAEDTVGSEVKGQLKSNRDRKICKSHRRKCRVWSSVSKQIERA